MTRFFSIPKPCSENWNEMDATAQGAFCAKCTREVVDCTSIKSSEIKLTLESKESPCVRIFEAQIDEMNFLEWFKAFSLKKQLKYAFLFAYVIVFSSNASGQDSTEVPNPIIKADTLRDTKLIQLLGDTAIYNHDFWELDALNEGSLDSALIDSTSIAADTMSLVPEKEEKVLQTEIDEELVTVVEPYVTWMGDIAYVPVCGVTMGFTVSHSDPYANGVSRSHYLENELSKLPIITDSPNLSLNNSRYSFHIEGDSLRFFSYASYAEKIRIKITKKGYASPFYFKPIQIDCGRSEILFPLDEFENGVYIVTVEGEQSSKAIELVYW